MRDLFVTAIVLASLPLILRRPWIGIIMWCWISYMNPHKLAFGFAYYTPFAMIIAITTLSAMLAGKEAKKLPWTRETIVMAALLGWTVVTTIFAYFPALAWSHLEQFAKIILMTFVTLILINTRERLNAMMWIIVMSIGYFGIKGGIFTLVTGGAYHVYGPPTSFISGNNEIALALVMAIPLMRYLQLTSTRMFLRVGLAGAMFLSAIAAIGSQSRGAFLAVASMGLFFWFKSRGKMVSGLLIIAAAVTIVSVMPESWFARMGTIQSYDTDNSAMGRINAWWVAWNVAMVHPIVGGGFDVFQAPIFAIYAPNPEDVHDVHSIYFEMLGEHGFVGLALFLMLGLFAWRSASKVAKLVKQHPELKSFGDLVRMLQASLIGYAAGGAFLGLAYFDLYYHLIVAVVIAERLVLQALNQNILGQQTAVTSPKRQVPAMDIRASSPFKTTPR